VRTPRPVAMIPAMPITRLLNRMLKFSGVILALHNTSVVSKNSNNVQYAKKVCV
jgi:hypothetical protein